MSQRKEKKIVSCVYWNERIVFPAIFIQPELTLYFILPFRLLYLSNTKSETQICNFSLSNTFCNFHAQREIYLLFKKMAGISCHHKNTSVSFLTWITSIIAGYYKTSKVKMISLDVSLQNETKGDNFISDIQSKLNDSKWYWFFLSIFLAQIWVIFLTFYNSRVIGLIMTAVINKFAKLGHIKLGKKIHIHVVSIGCVGNLGLH